jgi:Lamin Tail Domain
MVKILRVVANPAGPDLAGEFVEIINPTDATVDLAGCTVGDLRGRGGRRPLYSFASSYTLDPVSSTAPRRLLRIFTGPGVPTDPAFLQIPLSRGAPVWNNAGDTAWITNSLGQTVDTFVYPAGPNPTQLTPTPPFPTTAVVVVPPTSILPPGAVPAGTLPAGALIPTPITVEEGDRLVFAAAGEIWVGYGLGSGRSGPEGKSTEAAGTDIRPRTPHRSASLGRSGRRASSS